MALSIKTKIASGIGVLFALLAITSIVALVAINLLSNKTENLLTANYKTIRYCNEMMHAMDLLPGNAAAMAQFEKALASQEQNITEPGEGPSTAKIRIYFERLKSGIVDKNEIDTINNTLYSVSQMNQRALEQKNVRALATASNAKLWLTFLITLVLLVGFTLALNLPSTIAYPVKQLTEGIREIAKKNYKKRIYIDNKDEFGEMAKAFNSMAEQLDEWEHSSMAQIMFEKSRVDSIISQMEDAVLGLDGDGKILFINDAAAELYNLHPAEVSGKYGPDVALRNDLLRTVLQEEQKGPIKIVVRNKEEFFILNHKLVEREGKAMGDVYTLKNITHFKELDLSKTNLLVSCRLTYLLALDLLENKFR